MLKRWVALALGLLCTLGAWATEPVNLHLVGVTAFRDKAVTVAEWQPTMDYLNERIPGARFDVVPLNLPEFEGALKSRSLDFLIINPQHYIAVELRYGVSRVATIVKSEGGKIVNQFGGVIFTRADRDDLQELTHLKGRRIAATDQTSFAAFLIQYDLLKEQGIDLLQDSQMQFLGFPQDVSVQAVLEGRADVGFVRSGLLEAMASEGKLDLKAIKVLNRQQGDFPFMVSSALFPEWPLAAAPHVSIDITNQVVAALLLMPPDAPAAVKGRYYRWSTPVEYLSVQSLMQRHRIYPFDAPEQINPLDVLREYAFVLLAAAAVVALAMGFLYWRTHRLNRDLVSSRRALRSLAHHDPLTGLPNRNLLNDRLQQVLAQSQRANHSVALCMLDLDGFKPINDRFGHDVGDRVLKDLAKRIAAALRACDTVARFGGDEFVLLINGFSDSAALTEVMHRVIAAVSLPLDYCQGAHVTASIGVSVYQTDMPDAAALMRLADQAMYQAKAAGGNRFVLFSG